MGGSEVSSFDLFIGVFTDRLVGENHTRSIHLQVMPDGRMAGDLLLGGRGQTHACGARSGLPTPYPVPHQSWTCMDSNARLSLRSESWPPPFQSRAALGVAESVPMGGSTESL